MTLKDVVDNIIGIVNGTVIPVIFSIAFVFFLSRMLVILKDRANGKMQKEDVNTTVWGILGLAVMISMWGLVNILVGTFFGPERSAAPSRSATTSAQPAGSTSPQPPKQKILPSTDE